MRARLEPRDPPPDARCDLCEGALPRKCWRFTYRGLDWLLCWNCADTERRRWGLSWDGGGVERGCSARASGGLD